MRPRHILVILSLLTVLSIVAAGYEYYHSLESTTLRAAEREVAIQAVRVEKTLSAYLTANSRSVRSLAGLAEISLALELEGEDELERANRMLDHFRESLAVDVCYLLDYSGTTIASSNRDDKDSFVGKNFSFRPYWKEAMEGRSAIYMALGVTSGKRGVYHSHPVYGEGARPLGVAVIKSSLEVLEESLGGYDGTVLVSNPEGIIFISNRRDWLFKSLSKIPLRRAREIAAGKQFGPGPWEPAGLSILPGGVAIDSAGNRNVVFKTRLEGYSGWQLTYFLNLSTIAMRFSDPVIRATGPAVLAASLLAGLCVLFLYRKGSRDLKKRREAEGALLAAQEALRSYSQDLERQVKERTREITSILTYTPAVVYIKGKNRHYTFVNQRYENLFGVGSEEVAGKSDYDLFPYKYAHRFRDNDLKVLQGGEPIQVEEEFPQEGSVHTYLSVKFPLYDESGEISGLCCISSDMTDIKRAQDQLRRLSDSIIKGQEKERKAVSLELHDELGQVLTALRMDAVWLRERLGTGDEDGAGRAGAMCELIDRAIDEVKSMATRLRPGVLDDLGLIDALDWYAGDFQKRTEVECRFTHSEVPELPDAVATAAYRITQEALTNVARHADASRVQVDLQATDGRLSLTVEDNGSGFDDSHLESTAGLGIAGMRERAGLVGGSLAINSQPGHGVCVRFNLRMDDHAEALH